MKNLTVTVPDEVYRRARIRAAEEGVSVSALVTGYLRALADEDERFARLEELQFTVVDSIEAFSASSRLGREELHERAVR